MSTEFKQNVKVLAKNSENPITMQTLGGKPVKADTLNGLSRYMQGALQKSRGYIQTIEDLVRMNYPQLFKQGGAFAKVDAPLLTTTTGAYNPIYGAMVWSQLNLETNAFGVIPKIPWDRSGWRVITAHAATTGGGVAENAALPESIKPTFAQLTTKPKTVATAFNVSSLEQELGLAGGDDMFEDPMAFMRQYAALEHAKLINRQLLKNVTDVSLPNDLQSFDRAISSFSEVNNCADVDVNDADIYGLDRDAGATWADAYVNHNSNVNRDLTLGIIDSLFQNVRPYAGTNDRYILLTGHDTFERIQQLRAPQLTFVQGTTTYVRPGVNGVQVVASGVEGGFQVALYKGVPILVSNDVVSDGGISRIYLINLEHLKYRTLMPTNYFETGISRGDPFGIDKIADEGLFVTMGELIAYKFRTHAKARDLQ